MSIEKNSIKSNKGGARPGAGRPKGSGTKLTVDRLLAAIDVKLGQPLEDQIADSYVRALSDPKLAFQYEQAFMNKAMADRHQVEVDESTAAESRSHAFLRALEVMGGVAVSLDSDTNRNDK